MVTQFSTDTEADSERASLRALANEERNERGGEK
jgi:hypothetical protein